MDSSTMVDGNQTERFFRTIYGPDFPKVNWIKSPSRKSNGKIITQPMGWARPTSENLAKLARIGERPGHEMFFFVAPMRRKNEQDNWVKAEDALPCPVVWVDIDRELTVDQQARLERLDATTVASGGPGKIHAYVPLTEPQPRHVVEALNTGLIRAFDGDHKQSAATLLRVPGSWHRKGEPRRCQVVRLSSGRWDAVELAAELGVSLTSERPTVRARKSVPTESKPIPTSDPRWKRVDQRLRTSNQRHEYGDSRHEIMFQLIIDCVESKITDPAELLWILEQSEAAQDKVTEEGGSIHGHLTKLLGNPAIANKIQAVEGKGERVIPTPSDETDSLAENADPFAGAEQGFTDAMLSAEVAKRVLRGQCRWSTSFGWLRWEGSRWKRAPDETVIEIIRLYLISRWNDAFERAKETESQEDREAAETLVKLWKSTLSRKRIVAIVALARGIEGILTEGEAFDAHHDLLNAPNGIVDLRTGELLPHDPDQLFTKIAGVGYYPDAYHEDWQTALLAIPEDVLDWAQIRYGQGITGYPPPDDLLIFQEGGGENGKTTVTLGVKGALGDYYMVIAHRALIGDPSQHPTELMDFKGARYAVLEELPEEGRLSVNRMKMIAGSPTIKARYMRRDDVEFQVTHTAFVNTNNIPVIAEVDHGTWRRLVRLRFPYTFRKPHEEIVSANDRRGDPNLRQRIEAGHHGQHEAALAWLVAGAVSWYKANRIMPANPDRVERDTLEWRTRNDLLLAYANERLVFDPKAHVIADELYEHFSEWLTDNNHTAWSKELFEDRIKKHREYQIHNLEKKKKRRTASLSRPGIGYEMEGAKSSYTAWVGLRFHTQQDDADAIDAADDADAADDVVDDLL